ncbi:peptidylprolyl isomerase [Chloroflexota bacterium]
MTKKQRIAPQPVVTRRRLSRWQRQRQMQRVALFGGLFVIVCTTGILGYGYYDTEIKPLHQTVIRVNEADFDMDYYVEMLSLYSTGQNPITLNLVADLAAEHIQTRELIRQGATRLGITIAPEEIDDQLKDRNIPQKKAYRDMVEAELLRDRLLEEYFEPKVPTVAPQAYIQGMTVASEEKAKNTIAQLEAGNDFATLAEEFSQDPVSKENKGDLGWLPEGYMSPLFDEVAFSLEPDVLSEPFEDETGEFWIIRVLEKAGSREIEGDIREVLKEKAMENWISEEREGSEVESYLDEKNKDWALARI